MRKKFIERAKILGKMKKGRPENLKKINGEIKGMKAATGVLPKEMETEIKEQFVAIGIWADYVILSYL